MSMSYDRVLGNAESAAERHMFTTYHASLHGMWEPRGSNRPGMTATFTGHTDENDNFRVVLIPHIDEPKEDCRRWVAVVYKCVERLSL